MRTLVSKLLARAVVAGTIVGAVATLVVTPVIAQSPPTPPRPSRAPLPARPSSPTPPSAPLPAPAEAPEPAEFPVAPVRAYSLESDLASVELLGRAGARGLMSFDTFDDGLGGGLRSTRRFPQDPSDSLYREARQLLNRGEWRKASTLFSQIAQRQPVSAYAADALYWQAFGLYRIGGVSELREALAALDARKAKFPRAGNADEADVLSTRIVGALAARGDAAAVSRAKSAATASAATCDPEETSVRASALSVLMRNDPDAAAPLLLKVLERRDECSVSLRKNAVMMIGTKGDAAARAKLADVAKNDPSPSVRGDAIGYLAKVSGDEVVATLEAVIRGDEEANVQRAAVRALGAHESPKARAAIRALVERSTAPEQLRLEALSTFDRGAGFSYSFNTNCTSDGCLGVAAMPATPVPPMAPIAPTPMAAPAIASTMSTSVSSSSSASATPRPSPAPRAISGQGLAYVTSVDDVRWSDSDDRRISPEDAAWLRGVYPRLETTRLKSRAVSVLARSADEPTLTWLMALVQREEEPADVRATALSRLGRDLPIGALNKLYDNAASRTVRQQIVSVLGERREPEATDKLIEIVRSGTDPQLRRSAISALNNKKDPRTTQLLLELIDR